MRVAEMSIGFIDLKAEYEEISDELEKTFFSVMKSGRFILSENLKLFERDFAEYTGTRFAVGVNSGSDALYLTLHALGIKEGDEVIVPSHTFISTADAIVRNEATPVFADIDPHTYCIDPAVIEKLVNRNTRCILPVHIYGHPADMSSVLEIAKRHDLFVVEDACQAHGAKHGEQKVGSIGNAGCFSFYPTKNLGAYGDGGIVTTNDEKLYENLVRLRNYGQTEKHRHSEISINSRLDELQAAFLRVKLKYLDKWNAARRESANTYKKLLQDTAVELPIENKYSSCVYHLFVIRAGEKRDSLKSFLQRNEIVTLIHYPIPTHMQEAYMKFQPFGNLSVTEKTCKEILSLPMHPFMEESQLFRVAETIKRFFNGA